MLPDGPPPVPKCNINEIIKTKINYENGNCYISGALKRTQRH
jgi:hypothetical protein